MAEVRLTVPSLYGGISRQPASVRHPHQVEDSLNALFSVVDGCSKRPGTIFDRQISGLDQGENLRMHAIDRDGRERYVVVYGAGVIRVFEIGGPEAIVTIEPEAQAYLDAGGATADDLRLVTIADSTLIVNTTVNVKAIDSDDFTTEAVHRDYQAMLSHTPAKGTIHRVDNRDGAPKTAEYYEYAPDDDATFAVMVMGEVSDQHARANGSYDESSNNPGGFKIAFQRLNMDLTGVAWDESDKTLTKANAFDDYQWQDGDQVYITGGTNVNAGWYEIVARNNGDTITLAESITSVAGDQTDIVTDAIGKEYHVEVDLTDHDYTDMEDIAYEFQKALRDAGAQDALIEWRRSPRRKSRGRFVITSPKRGANVAIFAPTSPDGSLYDYTDSSRGFSVVASNTPGTGTPVKDTQAPEQRWRPHAAPNQAEAKLDPTTMPVKLVRTSYTGDGSTPATFTISLIDWTQRTSGGPDSNPVPSLWKNSRKISDAILHRNRLVLAGDEHIVMSQADDLFNFFLDDAENTVDSDPIDLTLGSSKVTIIDHLTEFRQSLFITTKAGHQFELNVPEALTPETAAVTVTTSYRTLPVRPVLMGSMVYFAAMGQDDTAIFEYFFDDSRASNFATDITAHVRGLLPESIRTLAAVPNASTLFAVGENSSVIYFHRLHWAGQTKEQSAWSVYRLSDSHRIVDIAAIGEELFILSEIGTGQWTLERLPAVRDLEHPDAPYAVHLDRQRLLQGTYDQVTNKTTWTWPEHDSHAMMMVLSDGFGDDAGKVLSVKSKCDWDTLSWEDQDALEWDDWWRLPWDYHLRGLADAVAELVPVSDNAVEAEGDFSAAPVISGMAYVFSIELSRPYYRDRNGLPDADAWLNITQIITSHHESGPYELMAEMPRRRRRRKAFTPPDDELIQERGWHKAFWNGEASRMRIFVEDAGPKPLTATAIEYIVDYESRRGF